MGGETHAVCRSVPRMCRWGFRVCAAPFLGMCRSVPQRFWDVPHMCRTSSDRQPGALIRLAPVLLGHD